MARKSEFNLLSKGPKLSLSPGEQNITGINIAFYRLATKYDGNTSGNETFNTEDFLTYTKTRHIFKAESKDEQQAPKDPPQTPSHTYSVKTDHLSHNLKITAAIEARTA